MDRAKAKMIRAELDKTLAQFGEKHGFTFDIGRITFTDKDFKAQVRGVDTSVTTASSPLELDWNTFKNRYPELSGIVLGQRFRNDKGDVYRIVGLKPKNRKYPVIAQREDTGTQYKFSPYSVSIFVGNTL